MAYPTFAAAADASSTPSDTTEVEAVVVTSSCAKSLEKVV